MTSEEEAPNDGEVQPVKIIIDEQSFFRAVKANNQEECERVLKLPNLNLNMVDKALFTPLIHASALGYYRLVELFLDHGADLNLKTGTGDTALHWYVAYGGLFLSGLGLHTRDTFL